MIPIAIKYLLIVSILIRTNSNPEFVDVYLFAAMSIPFVNAYSGYPVVDFNISIFVDLREASDDINNIL